MSAPEEIVDVVVEIPAGSRNKYEYDHERHVIRLDRRLATVPGSPTLLYMCAAISDALPRRCESRQHACEEVRHTSRARSDSVTAACPDA